MVRITQLHNTIKFTYEADPNQLQFLDTIVYKDTDHQQTHKLKVKTYIKTTTKQLYVPADSFHPPGTHKGVVMSEAHRYRTTNTDEHYLKQMIHHHTKNREKEATPTTLSINTNKSSSMNGTQAHTKVQQTNKSQPALPQRNKTHNHHLI